ncbi:hypothetical protein S245_038209, partial [Arachis hypogaea]
VHNDDEVRALFMLLSNSSNCVFRTSDSKGDMGFQVGDMQGTIPVTLGLSRQHSFL